MSATPVSAASGRTSALPARPQRPNYFTTEFPPQDTSIWTVRPGQGGLPPKVVGQDVDRISAVILVQGQFETTMTEDGLTVYGYR